MYELVQLSEHDFYVDSPTKVGIIRTGNGDDVVLIDSGNNKDAGKRLLRIIEQQGWHLTAVFNTHSHADHIGGNRYLVDHTDCKVYAYGVEQAFTATPVLEPAILYGGFPYPGIRHRFLMAQEAPAAFMTPEVLPAGMEIIPLPGHSFDMVGFRTADNNVFLADALCSQETLDKYAMVVQWDIAAYCETLGTVSEMQAAHFIPSHAPVTEDIAPLATYNLEAMQSVIEKIIGWCEKPTSFEQLLKRAFDADGLKMNELQHELIGFTLRNYLSYLAALGEIACRFEDNVMLWQTV